MNAYSPPRRQDYEPTVRAFLPSAQGEELELRSRLLLMRDRAMATKPISSEYGWLALDLVERMARDFAFRPMKADELAEIRRISVNLVAAASSLDALFAPELPIEPIEMTKTREGEGVGGCG